MATPSVIVSAFLDEGVPVEDNKNLTQQLLVGQALGLKYWTPRFVFDETTGANQNICALSDDQVKAIASQSQTAGFTIGCIGTAIGKVKLEDSDDGNKAPCKTHTEHMEDLKRAIEVAQICGAKFLRAFSFYPPLGANANDYYAEGLDRLGQMTEACAQAGIVYLMEPEPNLIGFNSEMMLRLCNDVGNDYLLINPDGANMHVQGRDAFAEYLAVAEAGKLGFMHIKDYTEPCPEAIMVDEEALRYFGSVDVGIAGHDRIFKDLAPRIPQIDAKLKALGADGLILDIEGHMKGGGQFGGWSGPDGLGVAMRALTDLLAASGISYVVRQYDDIEKK
ncbi:MAG: sugar phosphate isomerase/epimerase [Lentisphaerae bacterium]|jgi:sugar phosphate isomerase/epimerase|nr:sugar phosphate isomerase/epimerase [Lentisphaerota bacterium]MBT4815333.1 sugar phosphate isomerase/epimerase [Lentisphaerota bacterium]MBT5607462.1 sugar phosphate isomerase/epimerase [Lentisphaerota bacterium]MBT7055742.1 sugar phosphate isomerase/epimerase [Lentisphaerota bacterium]MBT7843123.1 sugar phosphate isomerase/epimerase [Lentisphaerota bacterium]